MHNKGQNGKGDKQRPIKNYKDFNDRWDSINWNKSKQDHKKTTEAKNGSNQTK